MMKLLLPLLLFLGAAQAAQPPLLWGPNNTTQTVTSGVNLNGKVSIYSGTQNPGSTATIGVEGDLFIQYGASGGKLFIKQDNGTTTNWTYLFAGTPSVGTGDVLHTGNSFGADISLGTNDPHNTHLIAGGVDQMDALSTGIAILNNTTIKYGKELSFLDGNSNTVSFQAPSSVASSFPIILPTSLPASGNDCLLISSTGQVTHSPCYSGISSIGSGLSLVSGSFNVKSLIGTNNISIVDNGDGTVSLGETNSHLPGTGTVQSVNISVSDTATFAVSGGPISYSGVLNLSTMIQPANYFWAAPDGRNGTPVWRKGVIGDFSSLGQGAGLVMETDGAGNFTYQSLPGALPHVVTTWNTRDGDVVLLAADVGAVSQAAAQTHKWLNSFSSAGAFTLSQPAFSDLSGTAALSQISPSGASSGNVVSYNGASVVWAPAPVIGVTSPITISAGNVGCQSASGSQAGCLSSTDWTTFNGKQSTLTLGNLSDTGTDGITVTSGTGAVVGSGTSIAQAAASGTQNGYLTSTNWTTFNSKQSALTFSTGLTNTTGTVTVNTSQNIATLSNLTTNGFIKTTGSAGTLSIDTNTYLTGNQSITLSGAVTGSGITAITTAFGAISANTLLGNNTGSSAVPTALTTTQVNTLLGTLTNPMSTAADIIIGGASGTPTRLANGSAGQYLMSNGGTSSETWSSLPVPTIQNFTSTGSTTGYLFTVSSANATVGATYTNNGHTYTVQGTISAGTQLWASQASAPTASGTLTKASGTGDATITFSANLPTATYTTPTNPSPLYLSLDMKGPGGGGAGSGTGTSGGSGNNGAGPTAFGANFLVANAGGGGADFGAGSGGTGGTVSSTGSVAGLSYAGAAGNNGAALAVTGGAGANSCVGGGGAASVTGSAAVANSGAGGGGGGTGGTTVNTGGGGGSGGCFQHWIVTSPAATYPYLISAGGSGGSAGTSGNGGGAGAAGSLNVEAHFQ